MGQSAALLERSVRRFSLAVGLLVALSIPCIYFYLAYQDLSESLDFKAKVKASALSSLIASNPNAWVFAENRLQGLISREPVPLGDELVQVLDEHRELITKAGNAPAEPALARIYPLYDSGSRVGEVIISGSMRNAVTNALIAAVFSLILGAVVYAIMKLLPLRALKMATDAQERAETTLRSIGDAVIATDANGRIESINLVAEHLLGQVEDEVRGQPVADVVRLRDTNSGGAIETSLREALKTNAIVACQGNGEILRSDGTKVAVEERAAAIKNRDGTVSGGVLVLRDVTVAREYVQRRSWEATHDPLTGLLNRRGFENHVHAALSEAQAKGNSHALCYMDIDGLKLVNDSAGHTAGDELLTQLAALFKAKIRDSDRVARLGGDEFGLLLQNCGRQRAQAIAAEILGAVNELQLAFKGRSFKVGVSIGLAVITGDHSDVAEVVSEADCACYLAKEQGKNRVVLFVASDTKLAARRSETGWVQRISDAFREKRFVLYHQTYRALDSSAGHSEHLEILLRMIGDDGEIIAPGRFLPAAERFNLMPAIDRWVINEVFSRHHSLIAERGGAVPICAINLSGASINSEGMLEFIREQVLKYKVRPESICFELTETVAVNSLQVAAEFIRQCKAMGLRFALDDFGTGTSSFGYLRNLPVDYLKIDGGFVKNIDRDSVDEAMVETINRIGHILGKRTIAEFAENDAIIAKLTALGVDFAQGYGVSRPKPLFVEKRPVETAAPNWRSTIFG